MALLPTSCLTPEFEFGEGGIGEGGSGPQVAHCKNRRQDADESDTDCGGIDCAPCALGRQCRANADCANESCIGGKCQAASCVDGERNGGESDVDCGGSECAPCEAGQKCAGNADCASSVCRSGTCAEPTCSDRVKNGGEVDVDCGGPCAPCEPGRACMFSSDCMAPPGDDGATVDCVDERCVLICPVGRGDCNRKASDGCEVNLNTDLLHCGDCGATCDPPNAVQGKCQSGICLIDFENGGCVAPFEDCDNDPDNGCEVNLNTSTSHCGACGAACSGANGTPSCSGGTCTIACAEGYADCDEDPRSNGCEININSDTKHCGACDDACPTGDSNESPHCVSGKCGLTTCAPGLGDCDGDGTCSDPLTTIANCGVCGAACAVANGTAACVDAGGGTYECRVGACSSGQGKDWRDCDGNYYNGCEVDVLSSPVRCGGCLASDGNPGSGMDCNALKNNPALNIAAIACVAGGCKITGCNGSYADCDGDPTNGCEVNTATSPLRCGGCLPTDPNAGSGVDCSRPNANFQCVNNACQFTGCQENYANCSGGLGDGCETDLRTPTNCGACNRRCGGSSQTNVATASCSASTCNVTCTAGWCPDTSDPERKCTMSLGTAQNCTSCGEVCSGATPFCDPDVGCKATKTIRVAVRESAQRNTETDTSTSLTATVSKAGTEVGHRLLAVAVMALNPGHSRPTSVSYGGRALTEAEFIHGGNENRSYVGIWLLTECDVAAATNSTLTVTMPNADWGSVALEAILFENVEQSPLTTASDSLDNSLSVQLGSVSLVTDGWFYGAASNFQYPLTVTAPSAGAGTSTPHAGLSHGATSTTFGPLSAASYDFAWASTAQNGWGEKVAAGVVLRPASTPAGTCP